MAATERRYSKEEFARRGDAIYEKEVRPQLKAADDGKFAAIDIETGTFAVDADELKAGNKLRARLPQAQIWMVRAVHRFGGLDRRDVMPFGEVLEAADHLSQDEQRELIAILQRRLAQAARTRLAAEVQEARQEFADGRCSPAIPDKFMLTMDNDEDQDELNRRLRKPGEP